MTIKRMFDLEQEVGDVIYSMRHGSIVENEDVIHPDIRYNFYRTMNKEAYIVDNEVVTRFRYKPEMQGLVGEPGCFIVKTIYYKAIDIDTLNKYIDFYIALGYSSNNNNEYINKLNQMKEEYRFNANIRLIYFVSEKLLKEHEVIEVDNFTIIKDLQNYATRKQSSKENVGTMIKLFYVDFITPNDNKVINISEDLDIKVPVIKNTDLVEGFYLKVNGKVHRLNKFIGDVKKDLENTVNNINDYAKEKIEKSLNEEVAIKREIRKIAYEKYRNIIDLTKMEIKFKNELETTKYKNELDKASLEHKVSLERASLEHKSKMDESRLNSELALKEMKYQEQQTSSAFGFIRDVLKLL